MMDEGDVEDVGSISRAEEIRSQGKEINFSPDVRKVVEQQRAVLIEGDYPRSSIQQFVAMFDGQDSHNAIKLEASQNPCPSFSEAAGGKLQESTFGHFSGISTLNEGYPVKSMLNELQQKDLPGAGSSHEYPTEGMRMKVLGKSSGSPEYFVKNSLMGKGVLYRGPISTCAEFPSKDTLTTGNLKFSDLPLNAGENPLMPPIHAASRFDLDVNHGVKNKVMGKGVLYRGPISTCAEFPSKDTLTTSKDLPLNAGEKPLMPPSSHAASRFDHDVNDGVSLRDWIKSGQSKLHKMDSLCIFKRVLYFVHSVHSEGKVLVDLRPSSFTLFPVRKVKYCGRLSVQTELHGNVIHKDAEKSQSLKRPLEQGMSPYLSFGVKHQKLTDNVKFSGMKPQFQLGYGLKAVEKDMEYCSNGDSKSRQTSSQRQAFSVLDKLEEKWYRSPKEVFGRGCTSSSNVYCLGVFLFELLSSFDTTKAHAAAMSDLRHRILPPNFLSENPKEAGFCLWLLHPEPSLRPAVRDVLQSEVVSGFEAFCGDGQSSSKQQDEGDSELLMHFLVSMEEQKQKHTSKLAENLGCIEADIRELEQRRLIKKPASLREIGFLCNGDKDPVSDMKDSRFMKNVSQLENAYFSMRSEIHGSTDDQVIRQDMDFLKIRGNSFSEIKDDENLEGFDNRGAFFEGLCKYARYSKLEACGTLRNREITNSTNVICSLSFDRDEDYFAAAGVSKKIKIFDFQSLYDNSVDNHYPAIEMTNKSKLSCVCWNKYIRNYLASTDYDGIVKLWDASTGQAFSEYTEHVKRAWSVDFSPLDPTKLASGSDDCSVKLWDINEKKCLHRIRSVANVCCVQFSSHSSNMLAFGSADYKTYCYDLRNTNVPWCVLAGHEKAVSYIKFVDSKTLVSASTDNTLKVWDLNISNPAGISHDACSLTLSGHTNEKNFVGLSVADGYIACGSETNEVYTYYKSLPMPITAHKFGSIDPISGQETDDDHGQFVSSVCWKGNSNVIVAANSSGCIKVLRMV